MNSIPSFRSMAAAFLLFAFLAVNQLLAQGLYWESTMKISALGDKEIHSQSYFMPKMLKEVSENKETIIRLDKKILYTIDPKESTYTETTFEQLGKMAKGVGSKLNKKMAEMQEQMKDLPEEQRKMVEKMMGSHMPGAAAADEKIELQQTHEKKTIGGYVCNRNTITRDGTEFMTIWATKNLPAGYEAMKADMRELKAALLEMDPSGKGKAMADGMKSLDGFPIQIESEWMTSTVTKVEKHTTAPSAFEVPSGFKKQKSEWMGDEKESEE